MSDMKKVLILCTGNSCRSIMAEALVNAFVEGVEAHSSGVAPSGKVNPNAKKILQENGIWRDDYHSKELDELKDTEFDLIVTVCDHAKESCPAFPKAVPTVHVGFSDPDGKSYVEFQKTYLDIKERLLPIIKERLC
jgi:arsenate reductase